jgi:PPK2 family polyphosphate:nucleotide phosphotransferase
MFCHFVARTVSRCAHALPPSLLFKFVPGNEESVDLKIVRIIFTCAAVGTVLSISTMPQPFKITSPIKLRDFNPGFHDGLDKEKTREKTTRLCQRVGELQHFLYANQSHSVIVVLQGMDTAGKDGAEKRLLEFVTPAGVETNNFKVPTHEDLAHDFLWRIHKATPRYGNIGVFNRSHYEDVLVVRVLKLQPKEIWSARYKQINAFEKILTQNNTILLKFFLHISKEEQAKRLNARIADPTKNWKLEPNDLKMRAYWRDYQAAYEDAINHCSPPDAPWHIVPADHKWYRDYVIAETMVQALEKLKMKWPKAKEDLSKIKIK